MQESYNNFETFRNNFASVINNLVENQSLNPGQVQKAQQLVDLVNEKLPSLSSEKGVRFLSTKLIKKFEKDLEIEKTSNLNLKASYLKLCDLIKNESNKIDQPEQPEIPIELMHMIYDYISDGETIFNFAVSSKLLNQIHQELISRKVPYRMDIALNELANLKPLEHSQPEESCKLSFPFPHQKMLSRGADGKYYSRSINYGKDILYITDFRNKENFMVTLDTEKTIYDFAKANDIELRQGCILDIVSCHPTSKGVVLVNKKFVSLWNYSEDGQLELKKISIPYTAKEGTEKESPRDKKKAKNLVGVEIKTSTMHQGQLFINVNDNGGMFLDKRDQILVCDLTKDDLVFEPVKRKGSMENRFLTSNNEDLFIGRTSNHKCEKMQSAIIKQTDEGKELIDQEELTQGIYFQESHEGRWIIYEDSNGYLNIFDSKIKKPLLDSETGKIERGNIKNEFIVDDVLFIFYTNGTFKAIHLPTLRDHTELLKPFLEPYLKDKKVFALSFNKKDGKFELNLLLERTENNEDNTKSDMFIDLVVIPISQ